MPQCRAQCRNAVPVTARTRRGGLSSTIEQEAVRVRQVMKALDGAAQALDTTKAATIRMAGACRGRAKGQAESLSAES